MLSSYSALSAVQVDALREIVNIGAGHASTAIAALTDWPIGMSVPSVDILSLPHFVEVMRCPEAEAVCIYLAVEGDAPGHALLVLPLDSALRMADRLLGRDAGQTTTLEELECSALMEFGNIVISSFLTALNEMTGLTLQATPPAFATDAAATILSSLAAMLVATGVIQEETLSIVTCIHQDTEKLEGFFLYIPEPMGLKRFLSALFGEG